MIRMYRYSEEGRSFLLVDGRDVEVPRFRKARSVHELCLVHGVDGIGVLDKSDICDFRFCFIDALGHSFQEPVRTDSAAFAALPAGLVPESSFADAASPAGLVPERSFADAASPAGLVPGSSFADAASPAGFAPGSLLAGAALCAVAFADLVGVKPFHTTEYTLEIAGEAYSASILSHLGECKVVSLFAPGLASVRGSAVCEGEVD